jgi:RNA polymerase sigma-70 factor (ECF subfamily)
MLKPTPEKFPSEIERGVPEDHDGVTLRSLFDQEEASLLRFAYSLTGRREVAEEIVQEVFLQLHARWHEVQMPRAWLFQSVRHRSFHFLRKSKREVLAGDDVLPFSSMTDAVQSPDKMMEQMEVNSALQALVRELPEADRQLLRLKYFEGLKYREISERTGLSVSNVGYRLHHIMRTLASGLQPMGRDDSL